MYRALLILILSVPAGVAFAAGTLTYTQFYSNALGENRDIGVYLPNGYNQSDPDRYPVICALHGMDGDHTTNWTMLKPLLDEMIYAGDLAPVIVVTPDGGFGTFGGSLWANSALYGLFEDYVVQDVVGFVDATYKSIPIRDRRAIIGFSMGAIGSMTIATGRPEVFCAVAGHSGYYNWDRFREELRTAILAENVGPPYTFAPTGTYTRGAFLVAGAYSPNLGNPPWYVRFPLDTQGEVVEDVIDRWIEHNPDVLAAAHPPASLPAIYFDCGQYDEWFMYETNFDLAAAFDSLGVTYTFRPFQGSHELTVASLRISLAFLNAELTATHWSNAGGALVVHDTGLTYTADMTIPPASPVPACSEVTNAAPLDVNRVWKVYAAFPLDSSPRLKSLSWGVYPSASGGGGIVIHDSGLPEPGQDSEYTDPGWPSTWGSGVREVLGETQTASAIECYWFGGYAYAGGGGEPQEFGTGVHSTLGGVVADDGWPVHEDPIVGFGSLGFGQAGVTPCPDEPSLGVCCALDGSCGLTPEGECAAPATWHDEWTTCDPNPCGPSAVRGAPARAAVDVRVAPNPGSGQILLQVQSPRGMMLSVHIYDPAGRQVRALWRGVASEGEAAITWDGRDAAGRAVPAGVYLVRVATPAGEARERLVLTR